MRVLRTCSHCHTENALLLIGPTWCRACGHRADLPRFFCTCPACVQPKPLGARRAYERPPEEDGE